jgi:RNA polymerase sigma factor (sigma-70 family)
VNARGIVPQVQTFEEFFRDAYRPLLRDVMFAGGSRQEAEDALSAAMADVFRRWDDIDSPRAYARRAAIRYLVKEKQRGLPRTRTRLVERGEVTAEQHEDPGLSAWEEKEWAMQLLISLPPAQREVLACILDEFTRQEIAQLLGKTEAAVRQNLHAARIRLAACLADRDGWEEAR